MYINNEYQHIVLEGRDAEKDWILFTENKYVLKRQV